MGTDSVLLSKFASTLKSEKGVDLGTGSGVIPLLLISENKCKEILYELAVHNAISNGAENRFFPIHGDIREIKALYPQRVRILLPSIRHISREEAESRAFLKKSLLQGMKKMAL